MDRPKQLYIQGRQIGKTRAQILFMGQHLSKIEEVDVQLKSYAAAIGYDWKDVREEIKKRLAKEPTRMYLDVATELLEDIKEGEWM